MNNGKKLLMSAASKKDLETLFEKFWYSPNWYLDESDMKIKNKVSGKIMDNLVEYKGGRFKVYMSGEK